MLRAGGFKSSPEHWPTIVILMRGDNAPEPDLAADGAEKKGMEEDRGESPVSVDMKVLNSPKELVPEKEKFIVEFLMDLNKA